MSGVWCIPPTGAGAHHRRRHGRGRAAHQGAQHAHLGRPPEIRLLRGGVGEIGGGARMGAGGCCERQ
eukprot:372995-Prorocentrum_minimum.AAC.3